ncbi:SH3 domain-containing protein [Streptomyces sp. AK010]|uniref:SH3 domain-containing protein n=1 Tax=Streptomyces sp. AK010 TaxID=2723074 RepID=UPI0016173E2C|nr:SH3 domain-containing protein [Streptomyces sp. AK010]MBB6418488.1 putative membrane protein [Streptomyces sp. AK010]
MTPQRAKLRARVPACLAASAMPALSLSAGVVAAVAPAATAAEMPCEPNVSYYVSKSSGVNFRTGAGTGYASKGIPHKNDRGGKLATKGSWIKLQLGRKSKSGLAKGSTGWVSKSYVSDCTPMQLD